ncbi:MULTISPECIES: hypothetical protein [Pseudoalteromonas]|uniref:Secreted protein n=1 Tax=Pseudoalteromonas obscura TaxID=3048491 RepID=A0ABT7EMM4_9GAMM|nr:MULTISPECIES: hypothetical protein [Pseudoalteromonas]MBQ4838882.1 hypothetical protein [Pseudoalteromonas luteoviolacea]MDK2596305.1 hypothetical protein [Pseudoalteromonas sp. P94(2023)]
MNNIFKLGLFLTTLSFSSSVLANFDLAGKGVVTYPTGISKNFDFGFGWQATNKKFRIGKKAYSMSQLPESYSIALTLSKDETRVWIQEFNAGYIESFEWKIGNNTLKLAKRSFNSPVKGNYILTLNKVDYFLSRNNVSIDVYFEESGVKYVRLDGVTRNMGTKK